MAEDKEYAAQSSPVAPDTALAQSEASTSASIASSPLPSPSQPEPESRAELLAKARAFLHQPQIQRENDAAKRRFLAEKGLNDAEIQGLMRELPVQMPVVPPRSYPQPPPSNLPLLLLGLVRLFSWIAGGSAALVFIYYRMFLPRVTATYIARGSLKSHQLSLIRKLNTSLTALKESQAEVAAVLPRPEPHKEPAPFAACLSIDTLLERAKKQEIEVSGIPAISLLRCAISDFRKGSDSRNPRTEEVFQVMEGKIPWLVSKEGAPFENHLWDTLSTCPLFVPDSTPSPDSTSAVPVADAPAIIHWAYVPPAPQAPTALMQSLNSLSASIPKPPSERHSTLQHALQTMSDFTGYISSQIYVPFASSVSRFTPGGGLLGPAEEEVRKEIRALKGLVLNRRSFMPTTTLRH
ncbi:hypothetical protein B0H15DRAFT_126932 [Mycena belliarum]|uniref:Peroxisome membrane anchor protein Pex14p N-terminal domain-containing protein n=1 Tax=Mycena belliarum TaxID=1033014 RepID=A0AAD6U9D0_9AGAR|nr:hypothetical protein B0H15DRAFT_126932 [Mycena belliae]